MSQFNPDTFLNSTVSGKMSTATAAIPEMEARAYIKDIKARTTQSGKAIMDVVWAVQDPKASEVTGMDEPSVRQSVFLDLDDSGNLDHSTGKNIQLGRLRAALGQNSEGGWSPSMLMGKTARIHITQRPDANDPTRIYNDVKGVAAL